MEVLEQTRGNTTVMFAEAVPPEPLSFDVMLLVVLVNTPNPPAAVTLTLKAHDPLAARVPPDKLMKGEPAVVVIVPVPQEPVKPLGVLTTSPGNKSLNASPLSDVSMLGLVIVKLKLVVPLDGIWADPNTLLIVGGATVTPAAAMELPVASPTKRHKTRRPPFLIANRVSGIGEV